MGLALCTTVVGRWEKLDQCLQAVTNGTKQPDEVIVLDNSADPGSHPVLERHGVRVLPVEDQIGPAEARRRLTEAVSCDVMMFIDADVNSKPQAVERLYDRVVNSDYRAASGIWRDYDEYYRRVGNALLFDHDGRNVLKQPISYREVRDFKTVELEFSTPQLMIERKLFEQVEFDDEYRFLYEWWDFFMQLRETGERIVCDMNAEFVHEPGGYAGDESTRHGNYDPAVDRRYFEEKWGYRPVTTAVDDGNYNPSTVNRWLSYGLDMADKVQKRKL